MQRDKLVTSTEVISGRHNGTPDSKPELKAAGLGVAESTAQGGLVVSPVNNPNADQQAIDRGAAMVVDNGGRLMSLGIEFDDGFGRRLSPAGDISLPVA